MKLEIMDAIDNLFFVLYGHFLILYKTTFLCVL